MRRLTLGCSAMRRIMLVIASLGLLLVAACGEDGTGASGEGCEDGVVESESGLKYEDLECGEGDPVARGDVITVEYSIAVEGDEPFDSGTLPPFQVGSGGVVPGFDEGVTGMRVGGKRRLTVPPDLGYGPEGRPPTIPPNATLIFEVELLELQAE